MEIELKFGFTGEMQDLKIGDQYPWTPRKQVQNGGRPEEGNLDGLGYAECPKCGKDSFYKIAIREDVIRSVYVDREQKPYIL